MKKIEFSVYQAESICRYFEYAQEYLLAINNAKDYADKNRAIEHYLIFLTVAVENIFSIAKVSNQPIHSPSLISLKHVPELDSIVWVWAARNTVAHKCAVFHIIKKETFLVNGKKLSVNGGTFKINNFKLMAVTDISGDRINPPNGKSAVDVFKEAYHFWIFFFDIILLNKIDDFSYKNMWSLYKSNTDEQQ